MSVINKKKDDPKTFSEIATLLFSDPEKFEEFYNRACSNPEKLPDVIDCMIEIISSPGEDYEPTDSEIERDHKFHRNHIRYLFQLSLGLTKKRVLRGKKYTLIIGE